MTGWYDAVRFLKAEGLTGRAANCLVNLDCRTLDDARRFSYVELLRTPNLGKKTADEIAAKLAERGVRIKPADLPHDVAVARAKARVEKTKAAYDAATKKLAELLD
jgi:DNA-directed RNA polymerase alpha subunit